MDSSVGITKLVEPSPPPATATTTATPTALHQQQTSQPNHLNNNHHHHNHHHHNQQQRPPLPPLHHHPDQQTHQPHQPQHPSVNSASSNSTGSNSVIVINNNERFATNFAPIKQRVVAPSPSIAVTATIPTATQANNPPHPQPILSSNASIASTTTSATIITRSATIITTNATNPNTLSANNATIYNNNQPTATSVIVKNNDRSTGQSQAITSEEVDSFFENGRYDSFQAVEELIIRIEESNNETLARRALNLYQRHYNTLHRPWEHEIFMYGLGLIYMHFNAYHWAVRSFRETIYVHPGFQRSRDVHTRLGLIFKATGRYKLSEKHFNLAIQDLRLNSGTSTRLELKFHLAHLSEIQGKTHQAIEAYERLLREKDLPPKLSANIHRQLGWIHYSTATKSSSSSGVAHQHHTESRRKNQPECSVSQADHRKLETALNHLNTSYKIDSDSQTSYYLGRCLTNVGKVRDAFASYRSVKDMEETNADTWCSMGVLYQRQNQPLDALQAYIRSVQYDKKHSVAWMNLGILYESHNYFKDALKCYQHILRSNPQGGVDKALKDRISYIQVHLKDIDGTTSSGNSNGKSENNSDKLLSLEDLWNMESKTNQESSSSINSNSNKSDNSVVRKTILSKPASASPNVLAQSDQSHSKLALNTNSTETSENSNNNQTGTTDSNCQAVDETRLPCNGKSSELNHHESNTTMATTTNISTTTSQVLDNYKPPLIADDSKATSSKLDVIDHDHKSESASTPVSVNGVPSVDQKPPTGIQYSQDRKPQSLDSKQFCMNQMYTNGASKDSGISSDSSTYTDYALVPSQSSDSSTANYISAEQIIRSCRDSATRTKKIDINLISDDTRPPPIYPRPPAYPPLPHDKLFPLAPSIFLDSKKELTSKKLFDTCRSNPISILRNIANILKLDLGLFSTKTLVESNPDQQVDIVTHLFHQNNEVISEGDNSLVNKWTCTRQRSSSTISNYASYQVASFKQSLLEERDMKVKPTLTKESETDSNESSLAKKSATDGLSKQISDTQGHKSGPACKKFKRDEGQVKLVKSANMIDISCEQSWRPQLNELNKLPYFLRCVSAANMLTHIGTAVPGLNTNTLSMLVPGCKFVGNQRHNQMCSLSLNIGPGEFEWHAIPGEYERTLRKLCNRNGFDYEEDDWWPRLEDLQKYNIPVYRFSQRPGDLVWVNSSTIYWVQSTGWTNCIQWNLGPLNAQQYRLTSESCELDKLFFRKSHVPVVQMTWNLVMNISIIQDDDLFQQMTNVMRRSLRYCRIIMELCDSLKRDIDISDEVPGPRSAKFCSLCECEVFNITFKWKQEPGVHCIECALRSSEKEKLSSSYKIDQVYDLSYLMQLYDNFIENKKKFQTRQNQIMQQQQKQQQLQQKQQQQQQQQQSHQKQ